MKYQNKEQINDVLNIEKEHRKEIIQSIIYYILFNNNKNKIRY